MDSQNSNLSDIIQQMLNKKLSKLKHTIDAFHKSKTENKCFVSGCDNNAILSHSISEAKILSLLQERVEKGQVLIFHVDNKINKDYRQKEISTYHSSERTLNKTGKSISSVFYGFCSLHDSSLFKSLDNMSFEDSDEIKFLHAYRAFAHYISKSHDSFSFLNEKAISLTQLISEISISSELIEEIQNGIDFRMKEDKKLIALFNEIYFSKKFNDFSYFYRSIDGFFPITGNFIFELKKGFQLAFTFFSEYQHLKTHFILTAIKKTTEANTYFKNLNALNDADFKTQVSEIIITQGANVFMAPSYWELLSENIKKKFVVTKQIKPLKEPKNLFKENKKTNNGS